MSNSAFQQRQTGNASETAAGSVEQATAAEVAAKTDIGASGAPLFVVPSLIQSYALLEEKTSNYAATAENAGKMWMRTDISGADIYMVLKYSGAGVWSSVASMTNARTNTGGAGSSGTGAVVFGGNLSGGAQTNSTEKYNGTSWSSSGNLSIATVNHGSAGTESAGLMFAGYTSVNVATSYTYNGTSWSSAGSLAGTARRAVIGCGTASAALAVCGFTSGYSSLVDIWNGLTWSAGSANSYGLAANDTTGTTSAAISMGGDDGTTRAYVTLFNGSTWSIGTSLPAARYRSRSIGTQNDVLLAGGITTTVQNSCLLWNGVVWSTSANSLSVGRASHGRGGGISSSAVFAGEIDLSSNVTGTTEIQSSGTYYAVRRIATTAV